MNYKKFLLFFFISAQSLWSYDNSWMLDSDLYFGNSYRQDRFSFLTGHAFEKFFKETDEKRIHKLPFYQICFKNKWSLCGYFFRLEADFGWSNQGKLHEVAKFSPTYSLNTRSDVNNGITRDCILGWGYLLPLSAYFKIGPAGGWSYQHQQFQTEDPQKKSFITHSKFQGRWQGPWAGVDVLWGSACWRYAIDGGYEYHFGHFRGLWHLHAPEYFSLSEKQFSNNVHGQVFYLNGRWNFGSVFGCNCCLGSEWCIGIGLKYQSWKAHHGKNQFFIGSQSSSGSSERHSHSGNSSSNFIEESILKHADWKSFTISLDFGVSF